MKERIISRCEAETGKMKENTAGEYENSVYTVEQYRPRVWRRVLAAAAAFAVVVCGGGLALHNIAKGNFMDAPEYSASDAVLAEPLYELPEELDAFFAEEGLTFDGSVLTEEQKDAVIKAFRTVDWSEYKYVSGQIASDETELAGAADSFDYESALHTLTNDSADSYSEISLFSDIMLIYNESASYCIGYNINIELVNKIEIAVYGRVITEIQEEISNNEESAKKGYLDAEAEQIFKAVSAALIDMENDGIDTDTIVSFVVEYGVVTGKNPQMSDELAQQLIEYIAPYYSNITTFAGMGCVSVQRYDGEVVKVYTADKHGIVYGEYPDDENVIGADIGEVIKEENDVEAIEESITPAEEPAASEQSGETKSDAEQGGTAVIQSFS